MNHVPDGMPDLPARTWRLALAALRRLPQGGLSRGFGALADIKLAPAIRKTVIGTFARAVGVDLSEAEKPIEQYASVNDFFVRKLKPGLRNWPRDPSIIASPVDGITGQLGRITDGLLMQAKGRHYSAAALLGNEQEAASYRDGCFMTLYLSPRHYHRIHTPFAGKVALARHVPGALLPVNGHAAMHVDDLFARNERLLCYLQGEAGRIAVVAVGAYNVGRISAAFDPGWGAWVSNRGTSAPETRRYDPPVPIETGAEIMAFHLGSTVVLLFERGVQLQSGLVPGTEVRVGQPIART